MVRGIREGCMGSLAFKMCLEDWVGFQWARMEVISLYKQETFPDKGSRRKAIYADSTSTIKTSVDSVANWTHSASGEGSRRKY